MTEQELKTLADEKAGKEWAEFAFTDGDDLSASLLSFGRDVLGRVAAGLLAERLRAEPWFQTVGTGAPWSLVVYTLHDVEPCLDTWMGHGVRFVTHGGFAPIGGPAARG